MSSSHARRRGVRWFLLTVLALIVVIGACLAYGKYVRLRGRLSSALATVYRLEALAADRGKALAGLQEGGLASLRDELGRLEGDLLAIRAELRPFLPLCRYLRWIPGLGDDIAAAPALLDMAVDLSSAGWWGLLSADPLAELALQRKVGEGDDLLEKAIASLALSRPYFREAREALERAAAARRAIGGADLLPQVARLMERLDRYLPLLRLGSEAALVAPELLGADGRQTYLLLAQNNHELRPSGGFISGVGTLQVERGKILALDLQDSYALDDYRSKVHPAPPEPLARYMWAGLLLLRDANWSPDFPTSAEVIASLYQLNRSSPPLDGVIAADLTAVQRLVEAVAPLKVEGYEEAFTGQNLLPLLQRYWAAPVGAGTIEEQKSSDWWRHRKDIMGDLLGGVLQKLRTEPAAVNAPRLLQALLSCLEEKHLLLYLRDRELAGVLAENGWDGALRATTADYLMVVDANLGFNKVDANVERRIAYEVDLSRNPPQGRVSLTYLNRSGDHAEPCRREDLYGLTEYKARSYAELMEGCYWDYVRLYLPPGSRLVSVEGAEAEVDLFEEKGKAVFGTFFVVPPGETRELRFWYDLPSDVISSVGYGLTVQKQPGTLDTPLRVHLRPPVTTPVASASTGMRMAKQGFWEYEDLLTRDRYLEIAWQQEPASSRSWLIIGSFLAGVIFLVGGLLLRMGASPH